MSHSDIRIGTLVDAGKAVGLIPKLLPLGFESFSLHFWRTIGDADLAALACEVLDACGDLAVISSIGLFGNPLEDVTAEADLGRLIGAASLFKCGIVAGFAGAVEGKPLPESMPRFTEVWGELARRAEDKGVRIALENCEMGGSWESARWNIAHAPTAWELMFDAVPSEALGLQWEPCHQLVSLIDPIPQLRRWVSKVFHVHGKDATVAWDIIRTCGIRGGRPYVWHRTPGFGDTNWTDIISILRMNGFTGSIDIEGYHDPVYKGELEWTGQVHALEYLKRCRGGAFIPNLI